MASRLRATDATGSDRSSETLLGVTMTSSSLIGSGSKRMSSCVSRPTTRNCSTASTTNPHLRSSRVPGRQARSPALAAAHCSRTQRPREPIPAPAPARCPRTQRPREPTPAPPPARCPRTQAPRVPPPRWLVRAVAWRQQAHLLWNPAPLGARCSRTQPPRVQQPEGLAGAVAGREQAPPVWIPAPPAARCARTQ